MTPVRLGLVTRSPQRLAADRSRVITRLFVPGQEGFERQDSRAGAVLARIVDLDEDEVRASLNDVIARFDGRHRDLVGTFRRHAREVADRLDPAADFSDARMLLLGAVFTNEYAIEGAALCNPSMVAHPDQTGTAVGSLRFVMSVRGIGEGHRSSIGFRTGVVEEAGDRLRSPASEQSCRRCWTVRCCAASCVGCAGLVRPQTTSSMRSAPGSPESISTNNSTNFRLIDGHVVVRPRRFR